MSGLDPDPDLDLDLGPSRLDQFERMRQSLWHLLSARAPWFVVRNLLIYCLLLPEPAPCFAPAFFQVPCFTRPAVSLMEASIGLHGMMSWTPRLRSSRPAAYLAYLTYMLQRDA